MSETESPEAAAEDVATAPRAAAAVSPLGEDFDAEPAAAAPAPGPAPASVASLDVLLDIPVTLSLELGRTRMSIRELLALGQGSVVRLDRPAGEPLDILVNGCLVARGEVVVVNDRFGVRITEIASPEERIKRLR